MKCGHLLLIIGSLAGSLAIASGQLASKAIVTDMIVTNLDTAKWTHEKGDTPGSESVFLREDPATGGMDLLVRFPAGHVIPAHWHESNEHIIVLEGQLTLRQDSGDVQLNTGGFAFLPAREVQRLSCTSATRCTFYLTWDGKPQSHPAK
jgi:quercetin dioxygenase-like cupin family protein